MQAPSKRPAAATTAASLTRLQRLVAEDLKRVDAVILDRLQSETVFISEVRRAI